MAKITYHPEAKKELREAAAFYENSRFELGERFLAAVETVIDKISLNPLRCSRISGGFRCCLVKKFPYGIIYATQEDEIFVAAVMHMKRKPGYWIERIED